MGTPAILNGCILSTNIPQDTSDINGQISHATVPGRNRSTYERSQDVLINEQGDNIRSYPSDQPPKPPTRHHSNISRSSRNGDYGGISSTRSGNKSSSRGYSAHDRIEDSMIEALNPELTREGYVDGGHLVVSLPHTWTQQHRRGNQR